MPSAVAAELMLALVTTPDRAASIVGDLVEETSDRGRVWFWAGVLQTACSIVWRELCVAPRRMVWLGISGVLEVQVLAAALGWTIIPLWMAVFPYHPEPNVDYIPPWGLVGLRVVAATVVPFVVGWGVARRSKSRELASGVATAIALAVSGLTYAFLSAMQMRSIGRPYPGVEHTMASFCSAALFVMAGAILARLRGLRGAAK